MIIKIQEGIRIKSKDIHFVQSIFYLANKYIFDISNYSYAFIQKVKDYLIA